MYCLYETMVDLMCCLYEQVRHALVHECNVLYECKVCRNLFRSVVNFLAHKRIFCTENYIENRTLYEEVHCKIHSMKKIFGNNANSALAT